MTEMAISLMRNAAMRCTGIASGILEKYLETNAIYFDLAFGGGKRGSIALGRWNWTGSQRHPYVRRWQLMYSFLPFGQCVLLVLATAVLTVVSAPLIIALYVGDTAHVLVAVFMQWCVLMCAAMRARYIITSVEPSLYELEFVSGQTDPQVRGRDHPNSNLPPWWGVHIWHIVQAAHLRSLARKVFAFVCAMNVAFWMLVGTI